VAEADHLQEVAEGAEHAGEGSGFRKEERRQEENRGIEEQFTGTRFGRG
jgi:hypothetical protein